MSKKIIKLKNQLCYHEDCFQISKYTCRAMSQGVRSIHQVANRKFSSLFSVQGGNTDQIISSALKILGYLNLAS